VFSAAATATASRSRRDRSRRANAPFGFKGFNELSRLDNGEAAQLINNRINVRHISFQSRRPPQPRGFSAGQPACRRFTFFLVYSDRLRAGWKLFIQFDSEVLLAKPRTPNPN
jgi:hypothetical protein